jgi:hypothetical protein
MKKLYAKIQVILATLSDDSLEQYSLETRKVYMVQAFDIKLGNRSLPGITSHVADLSETNEQNHR